MNFRMIVCFTFVTAAIAAGCNSPFYTDRGALVGAGVGTGVGALTGAAVGHPGVGALVGAGVGTLTGAAIGSGLDDVDARNRADRRDARPPGAAGHRFAARCDRDEQGGGQRRVDRESHSRQRTGASDAIRRLDRATAERRLDAGDQRAANGAAAGRPAPVGPVPPPMVGPAYPYPYYGPYGPYGPYWAPPPYYYYRPRPVVGWGVSVGGPL